MAGRWVPLHPAATAQEGHRRQQISRWMQHCPYSAMSRWPTVPFLRILQEKSNEMDKRGESKSVHTCAFSLHALSYRHSKDGTRQRSIYTLCEASSQVYQTW